MEFFTFLIFAIMREMSNIHGYIEMKLMCSTRSLHSFEKYFKTSFELIFCIVESSH